MKFMSQEMMDELKRVVEADPSVQGAVKGVNIGLIFVGTDFPDGKDRRCSVVIQDGKITECQAEEKPAPSDFRAKGAPLDESKYLARISASPSILGRILRGETQPEAMVALGWARVDGDVDELINKAVQFQGIMGIISKLPVEW